jgi:hypothetical protein
MSHGNNAIRQIKVHKMSKLIQAFKTDPSDNNRAKLAAYLQKHMMAICMASPDEQQFLKANGFKG